MVAILNVADFGILILTDNDVYHNWDIFVIVFVYTCREYSLQLLAAGVLTLQLEASCGSRASDTFLTFIHRLHFTCRVTECSWVHLLLDQHVV